MSTKDNAPKVVEDKELDQASGGSTAFVGGVFVSAGDVDGSPVIQTKIQQFTSKR